MKRFLPFLLLLISSLQLMAQTPNKKALLVIVDGIPTELIHRAPTPNLDRIAQDGRFLEAQVGGVRHGVAETPTISSNGYTAAVTGTWAHKNNVYDNSLKAVNYHYPSIFKLFKETYPERSIAIFSTWEDNRTKLLGAEKAETGYLHFDHYVDGLELDTLEYPHDRLSNYVKRIDTQVALDAAKYIQKEGPDLTWVYLQYTDDVSHTFGRGKEFDNGIVFTDALIGLLYDAVLQRQEEQGEEWLILVTTDHGRTPFVYTNHGGQSDAERNTWVVLNQKEVNNYATEYRVSCVDIAPTFADYLGIPLSEEVEQEMDGISLLSPADVVNLRAYTTNESHDTLLLTWDITTDQPTTANVFISYTNNYYNGGADDYQLVTSVELTQNKATIKLPKAIESFAKVVLKTEHNTVNTWVIP